MHTIRRRAVALLLLATLPVACRENRPAAEGPTTRVAARTEAIRPYTASAPAPRTDEITLATWNIENFRTAFLGFHASRAIPRDKQTPTESDLIGYAIKRGDEDKWEAAQVILDPKFSPDVLAIEECCGQEDLEFFNRRWLKGAYETVIVFPSNTEKDREQNVALMLKPGFKVQERKDQYYLEKDPAGGNERSDRLFARGPAFLLVRSPSGYRFWVGVTHMKSKATTLPRDLRLPEDADWETVDLPEQVQKDKIRATEWRNREAKRTNEIVKEIARTSGVRDVILMGDLNDAYGLQRFDKEGGGDSVGMLLGEGHPDPLVLLTRPLVDRKEPSFMGYWQTSTRELIDHVIATPDVQNQVRTVGVFKNGFTPVASDHFPVYVKIVPDPAK